MVHGVVYYDIKHTNSLITCSIGKPSVEFFETKNLKDGCSLIGWELFVYPWH